MMSEKTTLPTVPQPLPTCGLVGRVVVSDDACPQFKSNHWVILFSVNCIEKTIMKNFNLHLLKK